MDRTAMSLFVDGARAAAPPPTATFASLREPAVEVADVLEAAPSSGVVYWHHDGAAWQRVVAVPYANTAAPPAAASPAARFLFEDTQRGFARGNLAEFDRKKWATDASVRASTRRDLIRAGADTAVVGRIDAEAARVDAEAAGVRARP
jgi:hypothetical protein